LIYVQIIHKLKSKFELEIQKGKEI
jgi:hypothetical protein